MIGLVRYELIAVPLLVVALLGTALYLWVRRRREVAAALGDRVIVSRLAGEDLHPTPRVRIALIMMAGFALAAGLLDVRSGELELAPLSGSRDIVLIADVSNSMLVEDALPNRLEHQRAVAHRIAAGLAPGDRIGLVAFAGEAVVLAPPTLDRSSIAMYLDALSPAIARQSGSALGSGVRQAAALLAAGPAQPGGRIAVLISDGDPTEGEDRHEVVEAVRRASALGLIVHTIGVGSAAGGPIPDIDPTLGVRTGYKREPETGEIAISRHRPDRLREISRSTRGSYVDASDDRAVERFASALRAGAPSALAQQGGDGGSRFPWLVGAALLLLGLDAAREAHHSAARRPR